LLPKICGFDDYRSQVHNSSRTIDMPFAGPIFAQADVAGSVAL